MTQPVYTPIEADEAANLLSEGLAMAYSRPSQDVMEQMLFLINGLESLGYYICTVEPLETGDD